MATLVKKKKILVFLATVSAIMIILPAVTFGLGTINVCPSGGKFTKGIFNGLNCENPLGVTPSGSDVNIDINVTLIVMRNVVSEFLAPIAGTIFMIMIVVGGIVYISSSGNEKQVAQGKSILTYAIIGLIIVVASYAIVEVFVRLIGGTVA